jgi:hypothetical protein
MPRGVPFGIHKTPYSPTRRFRPFPGIVEFEAVIDVGRPPDISSATMTASGMKDIYVTIHLSGISKSGWRLASSADFG